MTNSTSPSLAVRSPLGWVGNQTLSACAYLGEMAAVFGTAARSVFRRDHDEPLGLMVSEQLSWMFGMGLPLVALMHVGLGSFMAMQSYFGGTFVEGTGAVVGVGMIRNIAPMMASLTLAGMLAARITPELRIWRRSEHSAATEAGRLVAARILAATVAGPVLCFWGAVVGTLVGLQVAQTMMGISSHSFFSIFWDMLWLRDVVGVAIKGQLFAFFACLLACHEGLRRTSDDSLGATSAAACRAVCFTAVVVLVLNSGWFILVYHAGPAFGPTLLAPPAS